MRLFAVLAVGAESREIEFAERLADVLLGADGAERAKALLVVWTRGKARRGVYVEIEAFVWWAGATY